MADEDPDGEHPGDADVPGAGEESEGAEAPAEGHESEGPSVIGSSRAHAGEAREAHEPEGAERARSENSEPDTSQPEVVSLLSASSEGAPRNRRAWTVAIVAVVVVLAGAGVALGLSAGKKSPKSASTGGGSPSPSPTAPIGPPCPLTGLPSSGNVPQRPALAMKVDNYPDARPQSGLDKADVVFEEPVEGGITRLVAVFQCQSASLVGPIRSARAVDASILDQLSKPIFIHVGGIPPVLSLVQQANAYDEDLSYNGQIEQHPTGRYAPYDTYTSTSAAWGLKPNDTTPPAPIFSYSPTTPSGSAVASVHIPFSPTNDATWTWSSKSGTWLLSYSGTPATVANGSQIGVPNIVVESVHVTYGPWSENAEGGLEVQSQLVGSGPLMVFRNGVEETGTWQRSSSDQPTHLLASDGSTIALQPGETWVEIVPSSISVTTATSGK
jgi:hypothetical protein